MRRLLLPLVLPLVFLAPAVVAEGEDPQAAWGEETPFEGFVKQRVTNAPVAGAWVNLTMATGSGGALVARAWTLVTDGAGHFEAMLPRGTAEIRIEARGYDHLRGSFTVQPATPMEFPMRRANETAFTMRGRVVDQHGRPVEGALVSVDGNNGNPGCFHTDCTPYPDPRPMGNTSFTAYYHPAYGINNRTWSNAGGNWSMQLGLNSVREFIVQARHPDSQRWRNLDERPFLRAATVNAVVEAHFLLHRLPDDDAVLRGRVLRPNGEGAAHAHINVFSEGDGPGLAWYNSTWADENGTFELRSVPGWLNVTVAPPLVAAPCGHEENPPWVADGGCAVSPWPNETLVLVPGNFAANETAPQRYRTFIALLQATPDATSAPPETTTGDEPSIPGPAAWLGGLVFVGLAGLLRRNGRRRA